MGVHILMVVLHIFAMLLFPIALFATIPLHIIVAIVSGKKA